MKTIVNAYFMGNSLERIRALPDKPRHELGHQLEKVQKGEEPNNWKPVNTIGQGVREIRVQVENHFRLIYIVHGGEGIYVLHVFKKTSGKISKKDMEVTKQAYKQYKTESHN